MMEGDQYPELRRMRSESYRLIETRLDSSYWQNDWVSMRDSLKNMQSHMHEEVIEGIRITMPADDWARIMSIYTAHYHAASNNPAVVDAWQQYRALVALTERP